MQAFDEMRLPELLVEELSTVRPWLLDANNSPPCHHEESTCFTANFFKGQRSDTMLNTDKMTFTFENSEISSVQFESPFQALMHDYDHKQGFMTPSCKDRDQSVSLELNILEEYTPDQVMLQQNQQQPAVLSQHLSQILSQKYTDFNQNQVLPGKSQLIQNQMSQFTQQCTQQLKSQVILLTCEELEETMELEE